MVGVQQCIDKVRTTQVLGHHRELGVGTFIIVYKSQTNKICAFVYYINIQCYFASILAINKKC